MKFPIDDEIMKSDFVLLRKRSFPEGLFNVEEISQKNELIQLLITQLKHNPFPIISLFANLRQ